MFRSDLYKEKLKDTRWRKRRREILVRDNFKCQKCNHRSYYNEVHHVVYKFGLDPWDYEDEYLLTLCRNCHQEETDGAQHISDIIKKMKLAGMFCDEIKAKMNIKFYQ